jgi:hypothetical protein
MRVDSAARRLVAMTVTDMPTSWPIVKPVNHVITLLGNPGEKVTDFARANQTPKVNPVKAYKASFRTMRL